MIDGEQKIILHGDPDPTNKTTFYSDIIIFLLYISAASFYYHDHTFFGRVCSNVDDPWLRWLWKDEIKTDG